MAFRHDRVEWSTLAVLVRHVYSIDWPRLVQEGRIPRKKICMVRKYYVIVLLTSYISTFYIELCVTDESYIKYIYMIGWEYNHVVLPHRVKISCIPHCTEKWTQTDWNTIRVKIGMEEQHTVRGKL